MQCGKRWTIVATGLLALGAGAWLAWAGPILPKTVTLPPEVQAMAGLDRFRAGVGPLIGLPSEVPLTRKLLLEELRQRLMAEGLELGDDDDKSLPLIALDLSFATDPDLPQVMSVTEVLSLHQKVTIERLDRQLLLPTATVVSARLTTLDKADQTTRLMIRSGVGVFANTLKLANAQRRAVRPKADDAQP
jgi:hypothetical protein